MKILILSCNTGQGHNSAAYAVEEALQKRNIDCTVIDPLTFGKKKTAGIVSATYTGIMKKMPRAFGVLYKVGDLYSSTGLVSPVYRANAHYSEKLEKYILEGGFSAVICTHLFAMESLTALKKKPEFRIPCFGVLTDYTCIPFFSETRLEGYCIPHEDLRQEMLDKGLPDSRIYCTGIPVAARFSQHTERSEARRMLDLPQNLPIILVMCGGIGCGHVAALCHSLLQKNTSDFLICVLTGRNQKLKEELDQQFASSGKVKTVPYTEKVNLYMNASDVMISKPGGLTSTEAAVANIPLVHLLAFAGCETKNVEFFSERGISVHAKNEKAAVDHAWSLIENPQLSDTMRAMQRKYIAPDAADRIASLVIGHD